MRHRRPNSTGVLETRIDYVESRLDETIKDFKEAIKDNKQAMQQMEKELKATLEKSINKAESSRRWAIGSVFTVAIAVIGFILTNGFQI